MTKAHKASKPGAPVPAPEHAHNIWLAGLGAWAQAQAEGNKMFEALVRDGLNLQRQTQASLAQATEQFAAMTAQASQARWTGLSGVFEHRVAKSLSRMGMPCAEDWAQLQERLAQLEAAVHQLQGLPASPPPQAAAAPHPAAAPRKTATPRKAAAGKTAAPRKGA